MKSTIFYKKSHNKYRLPVQLATKLIITGTKDKIFILPGLGPQKVENHCTKQLQWMLIFLFQHYFSTVSSLTRLFLRNLKSLSVNKH
jgi:hypothetical protein